MCFFCFCCYFSLFMFFFLFFFFFFSSRRRHTRLTCDCSSDVCSSDLYLASPVDWRNEILYFLLVDRFSDGLEAERPLLDRRELASARPAAANGEPWRWDRWAESGAERWQGGTLHGVLSKLPYLKALGVTTLWLSPVFKQRGHENSYHGYGVQDFLDVDPR